VRTQVGIIGAGPAGLVLAHSLHAEGIDCVVMETRSRTHLESRVRAGVLEPGTVETMHTLGLDERLRQQGLEDDGLDLRFRGGNIHLDLPGLTGRIVMIYGQQEITKDLVAARLHKGGPILFETTATALTDLDTERPVIRYRAAAGEPEQSLVCDFVAGCDGDRGISRASIPAADLAVYSHTYDFSWLGVLARARPLSDMTYANSDRGFALCSRRSMEVSRLYLQVGADVTPAQWSDGRFWDELHERMFDGSRTEIAEGEIFQRDVARLRCFVASPLRHGRLLLAGDAAHILPPTGAKGLNLAVADAVVMAQALIAFYRRGNRDGIADYSDRCLRRVWKAVRFSTWLTGLLHRFASHTPMERELQLAELAHIAGSRSAQANIAEQYVGAA
jgi:p-hydroxybenzoate 3-monooxygenase